MRLILGSGSPRRRELLAQIGVTPDDIRPPDIDETPLKGELPRAYCMRMAVEKAECDLGFTRLDEGSFAEARAISVDYAIAELRKLAESAA